MINLLILTLFLLPTYVVRFNLFGLPTNLLMVWLAIFILIGIFWLNSFRTRFVTDIKNLPRFFNWGVLLFFLSGVIALLVARVSIPALGQFIVLFLEPMLVGVIAWQVFKQPNAKEKFVWALFIFVALSGLVALIQYLTLFLLPTEFWGNLQEPKRAISFFAHPNGYALFITPVLAFLMPHILEGKKKWHKLLLWGVGLLGLLLSLSRGGWLGLLFAGGIYVLLLGGKQIKKFAVIGLVSLVCLVAIIPNFRYRVILPFRGEKSSISRFSLWNTGFKMIKDNPVFGKGLTGFDTNWYKYNTDPGLEHYNFPHNIFLNFWVDTGLLGMLSFSLVSFWLLWYSFRAKKGFAIGLGLFIIALWIHGQIDIPYLKNDLATIGWMIVALGI